MKRGANTRPISNKTCKSSLMITCPSGTTVPFPNARENGNLFLTISLARKSIEPMALAVEGGRIRSLQRFLSETVWDEEQMRWNYHQLVADELGEPDGVLMCDESGFVKKGKDS